MRSTQFVKFAGAVVCLLLACPVLAQPATIAVFANSATDPNTATPIATPVQYPTPVCPVAKFSEVTPLVDVIEGYYDNPANPATDCRLGVTTQMSGLPKGPVFKAALKLGTSPYGPFSTAFTMSAAQVSHPCDGVDPTSGTVLAGSRTLSWCYPDGADGGSPITGWAVYLGAQRTTPTVTVGTANTAGRRLYTSVLTITPGSIAIQVAPFNAVGEASSKSPVFALTIQAPATAPTGVSGIKGVN